MKLAKRASALALCALLLLPAQALALEPQQRQDDLDILYETLKEGHPNLFANTSEAEFLAKKDEIASHIATDEDWEYAFRLQTLAALAKDSHTSVNFTAALKDVHYLPMTIRPFEGVWVLDQVDGAYQAYLGDEVVALNGMGMEDFCAAFESLVSTDNTVRLYRQVRQLCYAKEVLDFLGITRPGEGLEVTVLHDGARKSFLLTALDSDAMSQVKRASLSSLRPSVPATVADTSRNYFSFALDEETYYIQYNACQEDKELPMETFADQVADDLAQGDYAKVAVDLRNNGGGSDGVLVPILNLLAQQVREGVHVYGLIGEATFSSAVINAVELQEAGGLLVGEPTGGSFNHFGSVHSFTLPNSGLRVGHSTKFIDMSGFFEAGMGSRVDSLVPDIAAPQTMKDYVAGVDSAVQLIQTSTPTVSDASRGSRPLARARLAQFLYEAAGAPAYEMNSEFQDIFPFASTLPGVLWCEQSGIVNGTGSNLFAPARAITRQEAAVMAVRCADAMGLKPAITSPAPACASADGWARKAAQTAVSWGLLPDGDWSQTMTCAEGRALAAALFS